MKLTRDEEIKFVINANELMDFIDETSLKYWDGWEQTRFEKLKIDYYICPFLTKRSNPHEVEIEKIYQTRFMLPLDVDSTYQKTID